VQDAGEGEDEDEEEEDEEEEAVGTTPMKGQKSGKQAASDPLSSLTRTPAPVRSVRTSPTTSEGPRSLDDKPIIDLSVYTLPSFGQSFGEGKVRTVRQWVPRTDWAGTAQV
jgi:casein kinase II subunit beta